MGKEQMQDRSSELMVDYPQKRGESSTEAGKQSGGKHPPSKVPA